MQIEKPFHWSCAFLYWTQNYFKICIPQCARNGDTRSMQILLGNMGSNVKKKINVQDEDDLTPLHYAARYNQLEVLKLLVENHAGTLLSWVVRKPTFWFSTWSDIKIGSTATEDC